MVITTSLLRRTTIVALFLAALFILFIAPGAMSAQGVEPDEATQEPVWSADMLVVEYSSVSIGAASADLFSNIEGNAGLQIKSLWSYIPGRDLRLKFEDGVPDAADYTLQVGDLTLEFPEESSGNSSFKWTDVDVDWEDGQTISVRIVQTSSLEEPAANRPATGEPTISGAAQVDQTLTTNTSAIADEDGLTNVFYGYQWIRSDNGADTDIVGETDSTYTLLAADAGKTIKVRVSFSDDAGNDEVLTSAATRAVAAVSPGPPVIGPHQWTDYRWDHREIWIAWIPPIDDGGAAVTSYDLRYIRDDASDKSDDNWTYENGLTGTSYTVDDLTNGVMYNIQVRAVNRAGSGAWSARFSETPRTLPPDAYDVSVTPGNQTLTVEWSEPPVQAQGGVAIANYVVVHIRTDVPDHEFTDLSYWTASDIIPTSGPLSYTITGLTNGGSYFVKVRSINALGDISYPSFRNSVLATPNSRATGLPTITGTPQVGETLTADTSPIADEDGLNNVSYSYQWISSDNGADTDIAGETDSTYTPSVSDVGKTIKVRVNFRYDADNDETLTSEATVAVAATVPSAPQGLTVTPGSQIQELDVSWQAPSSNGGSDVTGYKVQWKESAGSWDTETDVSETTVTGTTHTITSLTGGVEYAVRVIATNDVGDGPASTEARATPADSPASGEEGTETVESDSTAAWTTTLTVGVSGSGSEAVWGYSWFLDGMGTLDERTYNEGDQTIEVMAILLSNDFVAFNVRPHPSVDFVLTVDGTEFASADASEVKSRTLISYVWATTLDWAVDNRVALSLTLKDTDSAEQSEPQGLQVVSVSHDEDRRSYITVVVEDDYSDPENTKTRFQFTWYDTEECTVDYNTYLQYRTEDGTEVKAHLGASPPGQSQSASTLPRPNGGEYALGVYCGTNNGDSRENLVASVQIQDERPTWPGYASINPNDNGPATVGKPKPRTYTTAPPMTSLVASPGSLTPSFHLSQLAYTLAEVPDNTNQITLHIMARSGAHFAFVRDPAGTPERHSCSQVVGYIWKCQYSYGEDAVVLSDADPSMPGFQIDLEEGENQLGIHIRGGSEWNVRKSWTQMYRLTVTRSDATGDSLGEQDTDPDEASVTDDPIDPVADAESSPLTSLLVDEFSLTPAFSRTEYNYTVADVDGSVDQITIHAMGVDGSHIVFVKNAIGVVRACSGGSYGYYDECNYGYFSTKANPDTVLSDADPSAPGFQVELDEGDTRLGIHLHGGHEWRTVGRLYELLIDRANTPATGLPTITGTPQVDQTLTADTSSINDGDGLDRVSYNYQWIRSDDGADTDIAGETDSTYTPSVSDVGKTIKVRVNFRDDADNDETLTSEATVPVAASVPTAPQNLTVATGDEIQELDASWQASSSNGGSSITGYKVQWKRSADSWDTEADVSQATVTGTTHTVTGLTGGVEYAVQVIASNTAGDGPASDEVTGTPAGGTSQQQTGDSTSPTVSSIAITSDPGDEESTWDDDGIYGIGDIISVTVTFSEDVTVKGSPRLELNIGGAAKKAEYKSAVGSKVVFSYTVAEGDSDSDGIAISENKLTLNGGSIKDAADNAADLTHDALAGQADHQVDGVRPTISLVALGYTTGGVVDDTYILGQELPFAVKFSEEVIADGSPQLTLDFDSGSKQATFFYIRLPCLPSEIGASDILLVSSNGCLTSDTRGLVMVFSYTISMGDEDSDGLGIGANALSANGTISDAAGNEAVLTHEAVADSSNHKIDGVPPEVTSIEIISDPGEDDTYAAGDIIKLNVTFSERLEVLWQYPRLRLDIGDKARMAYRVRRNPLDIRAGEIGYVMAYSYTVQDGDKDDDGISIPANALHRLWGELQDTNGNEVELGHEALASDASHKVATTFVESTDTTAKTGLLTITGTLRVGEIVTADLSNLTDDDGLDYAADSAHYAWGREGGGLYFEAMRDPRYVIAAADKGKKLRVDLQFFDDNGNKEYRRSAWTDPVGLRAPSNNSATGAPTITGTPQVYQTLTANTSSIDDGDGLDSVSYSYQWIRSDNGADTDIAGETDTTYTLALADLGKTIKVQVTFTDDADNDETLTSEATVAVAAAPNRDATGQPTISGTPQVDETLTADTSAISDEDGLANVSYQYQWLRDGADIAGQTNSTYRLVSADQDKTIKVRVTFRDDADNAESLTSMATTAVASQPAEMPAVLLTASFANVPADHNGSNFTFQLSFSENVEAGYARIRDHAFTVTGATIDSASRIAQGSNQGWNVEVNPTGNGSVTITLPETTDCDASGAICTDDSRKLSHPTSATVAGPPAISVSDATVQEAEGAVLVFTASLSHASSRIVTVDYATSDGTAVAGSDYTAASGTLTFNAGDTSQTVSVTVLTDSDDESQETLTLTLSNPSQATLNDGTGTGTIENGESSSGTQEDPPAEDPPAETPVVLLTASFGNMPATHNGSEFTFDLAFSENVRAGYARIRDDAFTISGGDITSAVRKEQGSNIGWTITVKPDGNGAVYITLPGTTDCEATGAICTYDERELSHTNVAAITGPG